MLKITVYFWIHEYNGVWTQCAYRESFWAAENWHFRTIKGFISLWQKKNVFSRSTCPVLKSVLLSFPEDGEDVSVDAKWQGSVLTAGLDSLSIWVLYAQQTKLLDPPNKCVFLKERRKLQLQEQYTHPVLGSFLVTFYNKVAIFTDALQQ